MSEIQLQPADRVGHADPDNPQHLTFGTVGDPAYNQFGDVIVVMDADRDPTRTIAAQCGADSDSTGSAYPPTELVKVIPNGPIVPVVSWEHAAVLDSLRNRFTYHPPSPAQIPAYEEVRAAGLELAILLAKRCPSSPELTRALDWIDEAIMCANAAIARNPQDGLAT